MVQRQQGQQRVHPQQRPRAGELQAAMKAQVGRQEGPCASQPSAPSPRPITRAHAHVNYSLQTAWGLKHGPSVLQPGVQCSLFLRELMPADLLVWLLHLAGGCPGGIGCGHKGGAPGMGQCA